MGKNQLPEYLTSWCFFTNHIQITSISSTQSSCGYFSLPAKLNGIRKKRGLEFNVLQKISSKIPFYFMSTCSDSR